MLRGYRLSLRREVRDGPEDDPKSSQSDNLGDCNIKGCKRRAKKCSRKMRGIENGEERGTQIQVLRSRRGRIKGKVRIKEGQSKRPNVCIAQKRVVELRVKLGLGPFF